MFSSASMNAQGKTRRTAADCAGFRGPAASTARFALRSSARGAPAASAIQSNPGAQLKWL
jgi:hypothetical protein